MDYYKDATLVPGAGRWGKFPQPKTQTPWRPRRPRGTYTWDFRKQTWGMCPQGSWYTCQGSTASVHPSSTSGLGGPSHNMDPSPSMRGQGASSSRHTPVLSVIWVWLVVFHPHVILPSSGGRFFWSLGIGPQEHILGNVGGCLCTQQHHGPSCPLKPSDSWDLDPGYRHFHLPPQKYFY